MKMDDWRVVMLEGRVIRHQITFAIQPYLPWVPEFFLACGGNFRCWPKADTSSAVGRSHERRSREKNFSRGSL